MSYYSKQILTRLVGMTFLCLVTFQTQGAMITTFGFNGAVTSTPHQELPGVVELGFHRAMIADNPMVEPLAFNAWVELDTLALLDQPVNGAFAFAQTSYTDGFRLLDAGTNLLATADINLTGIELLVDAADTTAQVNTLAQVNLENFSFTSAGLDALQNLQSPILQALSENSGLALVINIPLASPELSNAIASGTLDTSFAGSVAVVAIPEPTTLAVLIPLIASGAMRRQRRHTK